MKWFKACKTVEDVKKMYRDLMMQYHPDHGGDVEIAKAINTELNEALQFAMNSHFSDWKEANPESKYEGFKARPFADILEKILSWNLTIEIIGFWIYCFDSFEYKDLLKDMDFWFSKKHKAWVYSGSAKIKKRSKLTTDDIREMHGSEHIRTKEEQEKIA